MIAMAMICRPALLIADEPTTALDVTIQAEILKLIREVQAELRMSVLMVTHDFGVVANMADEIAVIYHGRIMEKGTAEQLFSDPRHDYLKALLKAVPSFHMGKDERLVPIRPIELRSEDLSANRPHCDVAPGEPLVEMRDVTKTFTLRKGSFLGGTARTITALDCINLTIRRGECLGLVGESGSGKTTAAKAILRALELQGGQVLYNRGNGPEDIAGLKGPALMDYRRRVQLIFQDPFSSLNPRRTINDTLMEPFEIHGIGTPKERAERARNLMNLVGLDPRFLRRYPHSFSGGQRQRQGACAQSRIHLVRRANIGPRRVGSGPDPEPAAGSETRSQPDVSVRQPQSGRGGLYRRPDCRDVPWPPGGTWRDPHGRRQPAPSLHQGPVVGRTRTGPVGAA
jgi:peptide/nickel transport system ATP-binding protein